MGQVIKHHSDQQDCNHSAINKVISAHHVVMGTGFTGMGRHFATVHAHMASQTKRLSALEQRLTEFHETVELRLEGISFDQAQQDFDRCEARTQTDQKLDSILKYMAGFESEISEMSTKVKEMKAAIGAMSRMSFRKSINGDV